jgi:hypothetical protein
MRRGWKRVGWAEKSIKTLRIKRLQETTAILIALFDQLPVLIDRQSSATRLQRGSEERIARIISEKTPICRKTIRGY